MVCVGRLVVLLKWKSKTQRRGHERKRKFDCICLVVRNLYSFLVNNVISTSTVFVFTCHVRRRRRPFPFATLALILAVSTHFGQPHYGKTITISFCALSVLVSHAAACAQKIKTCQTSSFLSCELRFWNVFIFFEYRLRATLYWHEEKKDNDLRCCSARFRRSVFFLHLCVSADRRHGAS